MTTLTPAKTKVLAIKNLLKNREEELRKLVPPADMARFMAAVLANLKPVNAQGKPNKLLFCTPASFYAAAHQCAVLGIAPGTLGHAYLVPYGREATMILGYKGMMELARRHPDVLKITAEVVYGGDEFAHDKSTGVIHHRSSLDVDDSDENIVGAYCRVTLHATDEPISLVMSRSKIEERRKRSAGRDGNFWTNDYAAMARKCPVRALFNGGSVPCAAQMQQALEYEQEQERRADLVSVRDEPREPMKIATVNGFEPDPEPIPDEAFEQESEPQDSFGLGDPGEPARPIYVGECPDNPEDGALFVDGGIDPAHVHVRVEGDWQDAGDQDYELASDRMLDMVRSRAKAKKVPAKKLREMIGKDPTVDALCAALREMGE